MRPAAWRVGALALLGTGLLALALVWVGGGWFVATERATMRFDASVYGLQPGAPVVLRGVRVGWVVSVGLDNDAAGALRLPVVAAFDRAPLQALVDGPRGEGTQPLLAALVRRGLVARLASQSLLTGLLYVDLDFDPARAGAAAATAATGAEVLIPTAPPAMQGLRTGLEQLDLARLGQDLAATAVALRRLLEDPRLGDAFASTAHAARSVESLATTLQRELVPLARTTRAAAAELRRVLDELQPAAQAAAPALRSLEAASARLGDAAGEIGALARSGAPLVADLRRTADAMTGAAGAVRGTLGEDSPLRLRADEALAETARAAQALRELAELLEKHPSAIVWGRPRAP